jgi:Zn-dependent oligopeptidase
MDLFVTGFGDDVMDPARGRRFRYEVLRPGGSQSEWKTMTDYLGRKPNAKAFYQKHGWDVEGQKL